MDILDQLCEFSQLAELPDSARSIMRLSLLDWSSCALAGQNEPVKQIVRNMVFAEGGTGQATLVGSGSRVPARAAALANGVASHALDYDDTHFAHIGHPSVAVIPAALAVAQIAVADGQEFLDAALIGVEASIRVGIWLGRSHYQAGFHQTATAGAFGATLAAGRLLGLNKGAMAQALGLVSTRASGLKSQFGTMGKPMNAGIAASNGVESALLAQAGFVSNSGGLDHFGETHHGAGDLGAFDTMGQDWLFETVSHKFHACCHGLHAMLEAIDSIGNIVNPQDVRQVTVTTHPRWEKVCNIASPTTGLQAKFSYRLAAAMALSGVDTAELESFSDANTNDQKLITLRDRVNVLFDPSVQETATKIEIEKIDGVIFRGVYDLADPVDLAKRTEKLQSKARALVGNDRAAMIWKSINSGPDMAEFLKTLGG